VANVYRTGSCHWPEESCPTVSKKMGWSSLEKKFI
jgi:hypothetical protein